MPKHRSDNEKAINNQRSINNQSTIFIAKISIVIEEADESEFWLEFIMDEKILKRERAFPLYSEAHELASIFITTRRTAQKKSKTQVG